MNKERNTQEAQDHFAKTDGPIPSPFMIASANATASSPSPFTERRQVELTRPIEPTPSVVVTHTPAPAPPVQPAEVITRTAPAAAQAPASYESPVSDASPFIVDEVTSSPTQTALRAIFGVDHEMNIEEIVQRLRSLPGIRHLNLVANGDVAVIDGLKKSLGSLGFGAANLRIYGGSVPVEFFRQGNILLAVQTANGFGPGVKEAIKLAAQEIQHLS